MDQMLKSDILPWNAPDIVLKYALHKYTEFQILIIFLLRYRLHKRFRITGTKFLGDSPKQTVWLKGVAMPNSCFALPLISIWVDNIRDLLLITSCMNIRSFKIRLIQSSHCDSEPCSVWCLVDRIPDNKYRCIDHFVCRLHFLCFPS